MNAQTCMNQCSQATKDECCKTCVFVNVESDFDQMSPEHCSPKTVILDDTPCLNGGW